VIVDEPRADDPKTLTALRERLSDLRFTADGIGAALGDDTLSRDPQDVARYVRQLPEEAPLTAAVKLFLLDVPVAREGAAATLAPVELERLEQLGVVELDGDTVRALLSVTPLGEMLIASDRYVGPGGGRPDHVVGVSISSRALSAVTVRRPVAAALDLGTGSGVQALELARHAERVVAVDVNPRAAAFARFNALLNGCDNVDVRVGNLFEPVEGERFDAIVSNPPYVISPESEFVYRDSGLPGDSFSEGLVRRLPDYLVDGGFAHVLVEWAHARDDPWSTPLRRWVQGAKADSLFLRFTTQDPTRYAAAWNADLRGGGAFEEALDRWLAYHRRLGIEEISWGAVVLRRRSGEPWVLAHDLPSTRLAPSGEHIHRIFGTRDYLDSLGIGRGLLQTVFALADDHVFVQHYEVRGGEREVLETDVRLTRGLRFEAELQAEAERVLTLLDGTRTLGEAIAEVAPPDGFQQLAADLLPGIVRLVELGFLIPLDAQTS
jgi:methylase of polypeptide subunit release factors